MKKALQTFVLLLVAVLSVSAGVPWQPGDVNCDDCVDINDVTSLVDYLLQGEDNPMSNANADIDRDGEVTINDLTKLIDHLLDGADLNPAEVKTYTVNGVSFNMVVVDGGTFTMGLTAELGPDSYCRDELPTHEVTLPSYEIGQTEVTQELWQAVMGNNPSIISSANGYYEDLSRPVENVNWDDCHAFIAKLNQLTGQTFRLPTEAEWEFAARGGNLSQGYMYAGSDDVDEVAWHELCDLDDMVTRPVATKKPNELGLYDMSGNVWERCQDFFGKYRPYPQYNPTGPSSSPYNDRVARGGYYWFSYDSTVCRVSFRELCDDINKQRTLGLRLVLGEDHSFRLSENTVTVSVGGEATVNLLNGNGAYTVTCGDSVSVSIDGDRLTVTGNQVGLTQIHITDNATGAVSVLRAIVAATMQTFTVNGVSFTMIGVEGGTFMMGAADDDLDAGDDEKPAHEVTLSGFSIGQTEVTQELWVAVMGRNNSANIYGYDDNWAQPVDKVEWSDCQEFIVKLNALTGKQFRLPTEAEWEFAARGGIHSKGFKYAGSNSIDDVAWYQGTCKIHDESDPPFYAPRSDESNSPMQPERRVSLQGGNRVPVPSPANNLGPQPVALKLPNELGLYDMSGNVLEYCQDVFGEYSSDAQTDPIGEHTGYHGGVRGGNCNGDATQCRVTNRSGMSGWWNYGLRLVLDEENSTKFRLSETHLQVFIGESKTVNILNGSGDYSVTGNNVDASVDVSVDGDRLTVTGKAAGIYDIFVTDNVTGLTTVLSAHVYVESEIIDDVFGGPRFRMVPIKGGTFTMGATAEQGDDYNEDEQPAHEVTVSDFYIGLTEVLQATWWNVMGSNPSHFHYEVPCEAPMRGEGKSEYIPYDGIYEYIDRPVEQVSWYDCQKFIARLNMRTGKHFRLPTEAEWEYAARGGQLGRGYKYAGSDSINDVAWCNPMYYGTATIGSHRANELGLYDMSGNLWEWCQDWYGNYSSTAQNDPTGPATGSNRVLRGGAWNSDASECRVSSRDSKRPDYWQDNVGIRLAYDADDSPRFRLSQTVIELGDGESMAINILNGHGAYSYNVVEGENNVIVGIDGNTFNVEGAAEGMSIIRITDNATGASTELVVVVVLGDELFVVNGVTFKLKKVNGGTFMMGDPNNNNTDENLKPAHQVTLSSYRIGQTEVTQQLWEAVMGNNPSKFKGKPNNPVEQVSWNDCQEFIAKLNELTGRKFRLPTEAEWEYAARGGDAHSDYIYAGSNNLYNVAWFYDNSFALGPEDYNYGTHYVCTKSRNALDLYDMSGNVWEWCQDWYGNYSSEEQTDPTGPATGFYRVSRGGSWCNSAKYCRVFARNYGAPSFKEHYLGLRLAL